MNYCEIYCHSQRGSLGKNWGSISSNIQVVHKVSLKFKEERQLMRHLDQSCSMCSVVIKVFSHVAVAYFRYPIDKRGYIKWTPKKWLLHKERLNVCRTLLKQNRTHKLSETIELTMEEIHCYIQFKHSPINLWRWGQSWIKRGVDHQEHMGETSKGGTSLSVFS